MVLLAFSAADLGFFRTDIAIEDSTADAAVFSFLKEVSSMLGAVS